MVEPVVVRFADGKYGIKHPDRDLFLDLVGIKYGKVYWWSKEHPFADDAKAIFKWTVNRALRKHRRIEEIRINGFKYEIIEGGK